MRILGVGVLMLMLAGCGPAVYKFDEGRLRQNPEHGVVSALGLAPERSLSLQVIYIDDKAVNVTRAAGFQVPVGLHKFMIVAKKDLRFTSDGGIRWKEAKLERDLQVENGHTYIPVATIEDDTVNVTFRDAGENYPQSCLPLYRHAIFYGGSLDGGKRPEC